MELWTEGDEGGFANGRELESESVLWTVRLGEGGTGERRDDEAMAAAGMLTGAGGTCYVPRMMAAMDGSDGGGR